MINPHITRNSVLVESIVDLIRFIDDYATEKGLPIPTVMAKHTAIYVVRHVIPECPDLKIIVTPMQDRGICLCHYVDKVIRITCRYDGSIFVSIRLHPESKAKYLSYKPREDTVEDDKILKDLIKATIQGIS